VAVASVLATREWAGYALFEEHHHLMLSLAIGSSSLLFLSSLVSLLSGQRPQGLTGLGLLAALLVVVYALPSGGYRF
jgi:hypothetical protein